MRAECGGLFTDVRGTIQSPGYPQNYGNGIHCEWLIRSGDAHRVQLKFDDISLERYDDDCDHDSIQVRFGEGGFLLALGGRDVNACAQLYSGSVANSEQRIAKLCGDSAAGIYNASGAEMLVVMATDSSITLKGFRASYFTECGAVIAVTAEAGIVSSEMMGRYQTADCDWTFRAGEPDERIVLTLLELYNDYSDCVSYIDVSDDEL